MSRVCQLTGKRVHAGNNVSHSNHKVRRTFAPNLHNVTLFSDILNKKFRLKIASSTIRTVDKYGGLDLFLLKTKRAKCTPEAKKIRAKIWKLNSEKQGN